MKQTNNLVVDVEANVEAPEGLFNEDGTYNAEMGAKLAQEWKEANVTEEQIALQELAKFSDLSGVIEVAKKKGYPSLSALLIAALAAVPNFKK